MKTYCPNRPKWSFHKWERVSSKREGKDKDGTFITYGQRCSECDAHRTVRDYIGVTIL